jgi:hypothetical protein
MAKKKAYDPEGMIGGPALPVNRAKDMIRVYPSDEGRKTVIAHTTRLHSAELHAGDKPGGAYVAFSKSEFKEKHGFEPEALLGEK